MSAPWEAYLPKPEPEPPPPDPKHIEVWLARPEELAGVLEMRTRFERPYTGGHVPVPPNVGWLCAGPLGQMRACLGFAPAGPGKIIITDLYDDDTWVGKRSLLALFADIRASGTLPFVVVPLDKPALIKALVKRGMKATGVSLELDNGNDRKTVD